MKIKTKREPNNLFPQNLLVLGNFLNVLMFFQRIYNKKGDILFDFQKKAFFFLLIVIKASAFFCV